MKKALLILFVLLLCVSLFGCTNDTNNPAPQDQAGDEEAVTSLVAGGQSQDTAYENTRYGFRFSLPENWQGYSIITDKWEGFAPGGDQAVASGPLLSIRHPEWTAQNQRQDIPIMIFTPEQWASPEQGKFHIGAAPIGPRELGRNTEYVFALPARYNYAFPPGYEEVEEILQGNPLQAEDSLLNN